MHPQSQFFVLGVHRVLPPKKTLGHVYLRITNMRPGFDLLQLSVRSAACAKDMPLAAFLSEGRWHRTIHSIGTVSI